MFHYLRDIQVEAGVLQPDQQGPLESGDTEKQKQQQQQLTQRIRHPLLSLSLIQGVSLIDECPVDDSVLPLLLHNILLQTFDFVNAHHCDAARVDRIERFVCVFF